MRAVPFLASLWSLAVPLAAQPAPDFLLAIVNEKQFERLSVPSPLPGEVERTTKFLLPASDDPELLDALFQNVNRYLFHREFLVAVFPERFPGLTEAAYRALVERRATRRYFAGSPAAFSDRSKRLCTGVYSSLSTCLSEKVSESPGSVR